MDNMHRRSIRLRGYDYRDSGRYFVTICTKDRIPLFGKIMNGKMRLNRYGYIAKHVWNRGKGIWSNVYLDSFIVMPNHIHMIICIKSVGATPRVALNDAGRSDHEGATPRVALRHPHDSIHDARSRVALSYAAHPHHEWMMHGVERNDDAHHRKGATQGVARTRGPEAKGPARQSVGALVGSYKSAVARAIHQMGYLNQDVWHRNYYEKIIRDAEQLKNTRAYIKNNPKKWDINPSA